MKKLFILIIGFILIMISCKKSEVPTNSGTQFKFISLIAKDTIIKINGITSITANAQGDGLTYQWTANYGTFIGSGSTVQWTVCHADKFIITCKVKDQNNNSDTKNVTISSQ